MKQAEDFRQESRALADVLEPLSDSDFDIKTQFKGWTIDDVIGHLHMFNVGAEKTLQGDAAFADFFAPIAAALRQGKSLREAQYPWLNGLRGRALFEEWRETADRTADAYGGADPKQRVKWAGPDMSALSSITARQMETWAHGQEVFDILGLVRTEHDRIRNIAHLGVATFAWSYANRGLPVPDPAPHVELVAPSGAVWTWNDAQADNAVRGRAVEFAQVVTQVRSIGDTQLQTMGITAQGWMAIAQCFAGPPENPPAPGARHKV
ncbi:TIGR03084 family metal-binding protein [Arenibacterium sp. CAU 1754]